MIGNGDPPGIGSLSRFGSGSEWEENGRETNLSPKYGTAEAFTRSRTRPQRASAGGKRTALERARAGNEFLNIAYI